MKKNIAIVGGGNSSEYEVSVKSTQMMMNWIDAQKYNPYRVIIRGKEWNVELPDGCKLPIDRNDFSFNHSGTKITIDCAIMAIHGTPGENGILQSYFELIGLPYNTCDVFCSALTFNKYATKLFLKEYGIPSADCVFFRKNDTYDVHHIAQKLGFPCFVKPNSSGSSCGIKKADNIEQLKAAIEFALTEDSEILIEKGIVGTEVTSGLLKLKNEQWIFPITEIVTKNEFFDYEAKYQEGKSEEITPARLSDELTLKVKETSLKIYNALNCRGIVRIDYIISNNEPYFLEVNTVPGMSPQSVVPQQIAAMGHTVTEIYSKIIDELLC